jgi:hypothetical protein
VTVEKQRRPIGVLVDNEQVEAEELAVVDEGADGVITEGGRRASVLRQLSCGVRRGDGRSREPMVGDREQALLDQLLDVSGVRVEGGIQAPAGSVGLIRIIDERGPPRDDGCAGRCDEVARGHGKRVSEPEKLRRRDAARAGLDLDERGAVETDPGCELPLAELSSHPRLTHALAECLPLVPMLHMCDFRTSPSRRQPQVGPAHIS